MPIVSVAHAPMQHARHVDTRHIFVVQRRPCQFAVQRALTRRWRMAVLLVFFLKFLLFIVRLAHEAVRANGSHRQPVATESTYYRISATSKMSALDSGFALCVSCSGQNNKALKINSSSALCALCALAIKRESKWNWNDRKTNSF